VRTLHLTCDEPSAALLNHRADAVVTRPLFPVGQLDVTALYTEPRVLVVPLGHRLADQESVTPNDIADEPLVQFRAHRARARGDHLGRPSCRRHPADLVTIPIAGIQPGQVIVVTRASDRSPLVAAFRACARVHLTGNRAA
jgi:LysR substrate binding domain